MHLLKNIKIKRTKENKEMKKFFSKILTNNPDEK